MSFRRSMFVAFALLLGLIWNPARLAAQTMTTGSVQGTVTNPKNAIVPNASVTLRDNAKGTLETTTTSLSGTYQFGLLDPGSYTITVRANGFEPSIKVVTVPLGEPVRVDFQLSTQPQHGVIRQAASLLRAQNGNVGITLDRQQIRELPNPGNDMTYLAQLAPGSVMNTEGGTGNFSNYGMPATSNRFRLDGMDEMNPFSNINYAGATNLMLGTNEVQEVSIVSNGYMGNYGEFAGPSVDYLTGSGENTLHGNATYFWNQRFLNANSFFNNAAGNPRPFDGENQWQGSLGGPLRRDKAFVFINTEGSRVLVPSTATVVFPSPQFQAATAANLNGADSFSTSNFIDRPDVANFYNSELFYLLNNAPQAITALDNQAPGSTSVNGQQFPTGDGCGNFNGDSRFYGSGAEPCSLSFVSSQDNLSTEWLLAFRFDLNLRPTDRLFFRFQMDRGNQVAYSDPLSSQFNVRSSQPEKQAQLEWSHTFGASAANQLLVGGQLVSQVFSPQPQSLTGINFRTTVALADGTFFNTAGPNPCVNPPLGPGFDILLGGQGCDLPRGQNSTQSQVSDDFTVTSGSNTVKIGGLFRRVDVSDHNFGALQSGLLVVNSINDFFTGGVSGDSLRQSFPQSLDEPIAYYTSGGYFEDDWRYSKTLSLTFALRVEHDSNPICRHLCFAQLAGDFDLLAGSSDQNQGALVTIPYNRAIKINQLQALPGLQSILYEPRFGFAWQPFGPNGKTVLRGGAGIFYNMLPPQLVDNFAQNPPQNATFVSTNDFIVPVSSATGPSIFVDSANTNAAFQNGFVTGETFSTILANSSGFTPPSIFTTETTTKIPQYQKWSLELQRQFGEGTLVTLSYVGNHGVHEPVVDNSRNAFGFANLPPAAPDLRFGGVTVLYSGGYSHYNGGTLSVSHRFTGFGTGVIAGSYTYSHSFDITSNGGVAPFSSTSLLSPQDPFNYAGSYGPSDYDVRHSGNVNAVWELPIRKLVGKTASAYLVDGWQLSGTFFARSGLPYSVVDTALGATLAASNNYFSQVLPVFLGGPQSCQVTSIAGPNCLSPMGPTSAAAEFNVGGENAFTTGMRNVFRGPRFFNADVALMKSTRLPFWEGARLALGVQVYNVLNHPNFGLPVNNAASPNFGEILNTVSSPTSIFGSFLGADSSPRLIQLKAQFTF